jgi:hypothetical protein
MYVFNFSNVDLLWLPLPFGFSFGSPIPPLSCLARPSHCHRIRPHHQKTHLELTPHRPWHLPNPWTLHLVNLGGEELLTSPVPNPDPDQKPHHSFSQKDRDPSRPSGSVVLGFNCFLRIRGAAVSPRPFRFRYSRIRRGMDLLSVIYVLAGL